MIITTRPRTALIFQRMSFIFFVSCVFFCHCISAVYEWICIILCYLISHSSHAIRTRVGGAYELQKCHDCQCVNYDVFFITMPCNSHITPQMDPCTHAGTLSLSAKTWKIIKQFGQPKGFLSIRNECVKIVSRTSIHRTVYFIFGKCVQSEWWWECGRKFQWDSMREKEYDRIIEKFLVQWSAWQ